MAFAGEAYKCHIAGKERWVFVLEDEQDGQNLIIYGTSRGPWNQRQSTWHLMRCIQPSEAPGLGIYVDTFMYAETVVEVPAYSLTEDGRLELPPWEVWFDVAWAYWEFLHPPAQGTFPY